MKISNVEARQIFDSRGVPTIEARVTLEDGSAGVAAHPRARPPAAMKRTKSGMAARPIPGRGSPEPSME